MAKKPGARLADFQYAGATPGAAAGQARATLRPGRHRSAAKPFSSGDKAADQAAVDALASDIDRLQDMLYADRRFKVLVVLQGTDTSGKDGTIRGVFAKTSALGVRTAAWKAPSEEERAHDYLWRIHQKVPAAGEIVIFNRSHYEDVLVPVVKGWITREETAQRFAHINDFESCWSRPARSSSSSCSTSRRRSSGCACRTASTIRPSTGSSRSATSRSERAGTPTRPPTPKRWPRPERRGRRGRSSRPIPRRIAT